MTDGYSMEIINLIFEQSKLVQRMTDIDIEIENLPKLPADMNTWMESLPDISVDKNERFKMADFKKLTKLNKEYERLKEREEETKTKLRLYLIDNVIITLDDFKKERDV